MSNKEKMIERLGLEGYKAFMADNARKAHKKRAENGSKWGFAVNRELARQMSIKGNKKRWSKDADSDTGSATRP